MLESLFIGSKRTDTGRWQGGSDARASDSRSNGFHDSSSNPARSTRQNCEFFRVKNVVLTRCRCAQYLCVHSMHKNDQVHTLKIL